MHAGKIAQLQTPADDRLEDTTGNGSLPALAVNNTQTDLDGDAAAQHCTLAATVETERPKPLVADGVITEVMEPHRKEVISDVVADVTGSGLVVAERMRNGGRYPFPLSLIVAQTGREIQPYKVDVQAFAGQFGEDLLDTWMVGAEGIDGASIDYNGNANTDDAPEANIGLGFELSWNDVIAEGVIYESGYLAIYSEWTSAVFLQFVEDAVLPHTFVGDDDSQQQTLGGS